MGMMFKQFQFDGEYSGSYGLYISGEGVYNAPARDVEMITIPGRNGAFPLDRGRFENIEITYPAGIVGSDEANFASKISAVRNWLCSKKGYCRLMDFYNPQEYRLAVYKSGLDVTPAQLRAGEFDLTFECKPQRFLVQGEHKATITTSGIWALNNTQFEARPLLEVEGYGEIEIDGRTVVIDSEPLGSVIVANSQRQSSPEALRFVYQYKIDSGKLNAGDTLSFKGYNNNISVVLPGKISSVTNFTVVTGTAFSSARAVSDGASIYFNPAFTAVYGTASGNAASCTINYNEDGSSKSAVLTVNFYIGSTGAVTVSAVMTREGQGFNINTPVIYGDSTVTALGQPLYIDCDLGEAYKIENDVIIGVNKGVIMGAELPVLKPGNRNVIDYDDTITSLKITPRTWII